MRNMCAKAISIHKKYTKEYLVFKELRKLPDQYILLQNVFLKLKYPVTHSLSTEKLKGCQIDFVVLGPPGIFVIEANGQFNAFSRCLQLRSRQSM